MRYAIYTDLASDCEIIGNSFINAPPYIDYNSAYMIIIGNNLRQVTPTFRNPQLHIIEHNYGYLTENSGTATIPSGQTSVTVNHGLVGTPTIVFIEVNHDELKDYKIINKTSTQFTVEVPNAVTADRTFSWRAWYEP